jgi:phosphoserine aminotransferase
MANRVFNFNPGPSTLPLDVLKIVQKELLDYKSSGMSIMESSHRAPEFDEINNQCMALAREIMELDNSYKILFLTSGASMQFAMIPMNFLPQGKVGAYVDTGTWSTKAIKEANIIGKAHIAASSKDAGYGFIPKQADLDIPDNAAYLHITTNNTIKGTQYHYVPDSKGIPLFADMSSDICSRIFDYDKFDLIYAGAQKNLGPAGVTLVAIKEQMFEKCLDGNPSLLDYRTQAGKDSLYNTPPCFAIYIMKLVFEWIKNQGGLAAVEKINRQKKDAVYGLIDKYPDYFKGTAEKDSRSWMNITLRLPTEDLEKKFIAEGKAKGLVGLKGHRSVGGIRISLYNAMTLEGAQKVAEFMESFKKVN